MLDGLVDLQKQMEMDMLKNMSLEEINDVLRNQNEEILSLRKTIAGYHVEKNSDVKKTSQTNIYQAIDAMLYLVNEYGTDDDKECYKIIYDFVWEVIKTQTGSRYGRRS